MPILRTLRSIPGLYSDCLQERRYCLPTNDDDTSCGKDKSRHKYAPACLLFTYHRCQSQLFTHSHYQPNKERERVEKSKVKNNGKLPTLFRSGHPGSVSHQVRWLACNFGMGERQPRSGCCYHSNLQYFMSAER